MHNPFVPETLEGWSVLHLMYRVRWDRLRGRTPAERERLSIEAARALAVPDAGSTAFVQVQMALNWIVDNFYRFAEWRAAANRIGDFLAAMEMVGDDHISSGAASPCLGTMAGMIESRPVEAATSGEAEAPLVPGLSPTP